MRVNTIAVDGLSSLNVCIGRVNLFISNPGGKWLHYLRMIRYILCVERLEQMTTNQNLVFTGRIDTLYEILSKIDLALSQMQNGNFKSATNTLSDAGNTLQCHIELNSDQSVKNTVSTK